jgi:protein-L-isoaspartate(D-aspartate) O-methyltransferase
MTAHDTSRDTSLTRQRSNAGQESFENVSLAPLERVPDTGAREGTLMSGPIRAALVVLTLASVLACQTSSHPIDVPQQGVSPPPQASDKPGSPAAARGERQAERQQMVDVQMRKRDITDPRVLDAMQRVPRHLFVPEGQRKFAYEDRPLPIGEGQTISQPYIVALMTQLAQLGPKSKALDIGTGSGYQAAVLAELCQQVYSIEIVATLADQARERLTRLGYQNIEVRHGDGYQGWPEQAPFDAIIVAAAPNHIPQPLIDQLAPGGRLIIPVGRLVQQLVVVEKTPTGEIRKTTVTGVAFVPMTGAAQKK